MLKTLESKGVAPRLGDALDFGCGIGRLTQALADRFERVVGVDIAQSMIDQARVSNRFPDKCSYVVNADDDLRVFPAGSYDFVISRIVLQHLPRQLATGYLREFLRVLRPGGVLVVQIPSARVTKQVRYFLSRAAPAVFSALRKAMRRPPRIPMHVIPRAEVTAIITGQRGNVFHVGRDGASGAEFESMVYYAIRAA